MKVAFCPNCLKECRVEPVEKPEVLMVRGERIEVSDARHYRCTVCGTEISDPDSEERTLRLAYDAYRRKRGLLTPEQIFASAMGCPNVRSPGLLGGEL